MRAVVYGPAQRSGVLLRALGRTPDALRAAAALSVRTVEPSPGMCSGTCFLEAPAPALGVFNGSAYVFVRMHGAFYVLAKEQFSP